jgi:hypothetical protein
MTQRKFVSVTVVYPSHISWEEKLKEAGYNLVTFTNFTEFNDAYHWCKQQFGDRNFFWNDCAFWFQTDEDAFLFKLRWS